jgi:membrane protein DedA with SNARE-associated domain
VDTLAVTFSDITSEPWLQLVLLFVAALVLEEAAILGAALLAAAGEVSPAGAAGTVFAGIMLGDWCLYGIGHLAARAEWLRRRIDPGVLERGHSLLEGRLFLTLAAARVLPWMLYPLFIGCGFLGVGFRRFALFNLAIVALYTALLFGIGLLLGQLAFDHLKSWGWLAGGLLLAAIAAAPYLFGRRRQAAPRHDA